MEQHLNLASKAQAAELIPSAEPAEEASEAASN
jgi:hypothetical protein